MRAASSTGKVPCAEVLGDDRQVLLLDELPRRVAHQPLLRVEQLVDLVVVGAVKLGFVRHGADFHHKDTQTPSAPLASPPLCGELCPNCLKGGPLMPTLPSLRAALLLSAAFALPACQLTEPARPKRKMDESLPPKVATKEAAQTGKTALVLTSVQGGRGDVVSVSAKLNAGGARIAGTQNDIVFDPTQVAIGRDSNGQPECAANRQIKKDATAFSFVPKDCGANCTTVRALVLSLSNVEPIPDGSVLYTCRVRIRPEASSGTHRLKLTKVGFSDPQGRAIDGGGEDGVVTVAK